MTKHPGVLFVPNPSFEAELVRGVAVQRLLAALTAAGASVYRDGVPVAEGELQESIFGEVSLTAEGFVGRIGATDWKAGLIEFGTSIHDPNGSLRRAIESLGLAVVFGVGG